jgi:uncharacterized membrane protein YqjE
MVRSQTPEADADQSLGDLVALAAKDVSQLVRYEIDLAKTELRGDIRRAGTAGALFGIAAFFACLMLLSLNFGYAYLLHWAGAWGGLGGAFGFVALTWAVLGAIAVVVALWRMRHISGLRRTRKTVTEGLEMLRRNDQHPEIAGREPQ